MNEEELHDLKDGFMAQHIQMLKDEEKLKANKEKGIGNRGRKRKNSEDQEDENKVCF